MPGLHIRVQNDPASAKIRALRNNIPLPDASQP
ncbi:MAG: hypothetical protein ACI9R3_006114 [Verrucomicrobiales bacterium]|jgi:hypothetical protein